MATRNKYRPEVPFTIKDWPAGERPREKLLMRGPGALSDAELLALIIRSGAHGKTALDLARRALHEAGGLKALLDLPRLALCAHPGFGPARCAELSACTEIGKRYLEAQARQGPVLSNPDDTRAFVAARLAGYPYEVFACLYLDNRNRVIDFEELFRGTIDSASVHPREVVRQAIAHNAASVILAHNHPSGSTVPSESDKRLTRRLRDALGLIDIRVLDHFVVGHGTSASFSELGLL